MPYLLKIGKASKWRLDLLNQLYNAYTQRFLGLCDIKPGMFVLDAGCGTGEMSCWLAKQVAPNGKVFALDQSEQQLAIVRRNAERLAIKNIEYFRASVDDLSKLKETFDLVYCRWLLLHLQKPKEALNNLYIKVKPGGYFAYEDSIDGGFFCYPESDLFNEWLVLISSVAKTLNLDGYSASRIYHTFLELGYTDVKVSLVQPVLQTAEEKQVIYLNIEEMSRIIKHNNIMPIQELDNLLAALKHFTQQNHLIGFSRNIQVCGVKNN